MQGKQRGILVVIVMVAVVLVLAIGIIIGHFAVPKTQSYQQWAEDERHESISEKLIQEMKAENIESYLRDLTAHPHLAGTAADLSTAQNLSEFWKQQSFSRVSIVPYRVLLSYPDKENPNLVYLLDSNGETLHRTQKMEKILRPEQNQSDVVPPFHAYSKPGSVTSEKLIYVNYGRVEDFIWLKENMSINFNNTIVIARYGKIFRGDKVSNAENFGAKGILIYSDPADYAVDGETSVYPDSWWLPGTGVQRGTVYNGEGDPSTVGYPSLESSHRDISDRSEWPLPTISSHPIGYNDAIQFLGNMTGEVAPPEWQGKLSITYRIGPGLKNASWKVQMNISTHDQYRTTYNVFGFIEGSVEPDRYVLIGNHRDAWVFGAADPSSGTAAMMEMSRAFGQMVKQGWRPRRTLIFCSWGAEEYGLIGSWEWVENFVKNLNQRAVAYLNVDIAVQGNYSIRASSTPSLHKIIYESSKKIPNPNPEEVKSDRPTLYDTWVNSFPRKGSKPKTPFIGTVGAGSDFTGFLQLVGVSSMDTRYTYNTNEWKVSSYPLYHSVYETFHLMSKLIDRGFQYHLAVSRLWGEIARSLADSLIIPLNVEDYAETIVQLKESLDAGYGQLMRDNGLGECLSYLEDAVKNFTDVAKDFQKRLSKLDKANPLAVRAMNDQLMYLERGFIDSAGLPGRKYFKHILFAPSSHNSYAGEAFPGLVDAMFEIEKTSSTEKTERWDEVKKHLSVVTFTIMSATSTLVDHIQF